MPQATGNRTAGGGCRVVLGAVAAALPALLAGCALAPSAATTVASSPAASVDRLPAVAAGFRRGEARPVGGAGPPGREVAYATEGSRFTAAATVELLAEDATAAAALESMLAELLRPAPAREVRDAGRFAVAAADAAPPLLCARTDGRYGRERVAGLACAGRVGGALLRIRVAMPAREPALADPRAFAEAIAAALSSSAPPG